MQCSACGADNPIGMKFCGQCGAPLRRAAREAELRQITVMFCDLVGSTALADSLEPEDLREITGTYHAVCAEVIARYQGHIAQYLGDGLLVYFGYPTAHEDDARRAGRAALGIIDGIGALNALLKADRGLELSVRIGIHTGPVVVGEVGAGERRENLALGRTPNLAARVQGLAEPGTVVVSDETYRIARGFFDFQELGAQELRGLSETVKLYRVIGETGADSPMDAARRVGLTPLTGRSTELHSLQARWDSLRDGGAHTVLVCGEAGIGKSRIVGTLRESVERQDATVLECFCSPYYENSSLFPLVAMVERALGFTHETTADEKRGALEQRLLRRGILTDESLGLMAQLLSIALPDRPPLELSPARQRERTMETLRSWLVAVASDGPVLWIVEDLHWADPTTLEFVGSMVTGASSAPLMAILTYRPDFDAPWVDARRVSLVQLARLASGDTSAMVARVAKNKPLPPEVLSQIIERTEGVPLFVEEVTKAVLELGVLVERDDRYELNGPLPPDLIPATVQGSLIARLDRLGTAKPVAQLAAAIGREFRFDVLCAVSPLDEASLRDTLRRLMSAEIIYKVGSPPDETYLFKHALIQDAAYQSVLRKSRRDVHGRIGDALIEHFSAVAESRPELVAEHFSRAGRNLEAARYWLRAGQVAAGRAAHHEAIAHLRRGLALVSLLTEDERLELELELQLTLAASISQTRGWAAPELETVFRRGHELAALLPNTPHRIQLLSLSFAFHFVAGRVRESLALAQEVYAVGTAVGNPALITVGHGNCCVSYQYGGAIRAAVEHGEAAVANFNLEQEWWIARLWGQSVTVASYCYLSESLWMFGYPERGREASIKAIALAREMGHMPSLSFALSYQTQFYHLMRDTASIHALADESLQLARAERYAFWEPVVMVFDGWAMTTDGDAEGGIGMIREGLARYRGAGNGVAQVRMLAVLAEAAWASGLCDEAFDLLAEGMSIAKATGEAFFEPELYRIRGEFLRERGEVPAARASMLEALILARGQEALGLELRAVMSLFALESAAGTAQAERESLADVLGRFTEGFDTPDLQDARRMLGVAR